MSTSCYVRIHNDIFLLQFPFRPLRPLGIWHIPTTKIIWTLSRRLKLENQEMLLRLDFSYLGPLSRTPYNVRWLRL